MVIMCIPAEIIEARINEEIHMAKFEAAIERAIKMAEQDGYWKSIRAENDPRNQQIELMSLYPELFETL